MKDDELATSPGPERELTFGEKAVGINFNPGGDPRVNECKRSFATQIDSIGDPTKGSPKGEAGLTTLFVLQLSAHAWQHKWLS